MFVGNEAVGVRAELTGREVSDYIKRVKAAINNPAIEVGTAEVWATWLTEPELADGADFVGIHLLPYWEGVSYEESMEYVTSSFEQIARLYPDKKIVIGEAGWPSDGRVKQGSVPSPAFEAAFLRKFFALAEQKDYDYYIIEAYDQPWKGAAGREGAVGAFWGMLDAEGNAKFKLSGPLSSFGQWQVFAAIAAGLTFLIGLAVMLAVPALSVRGYFLLAGTVALVVSGGLFIVEASSLRYIDMGTIGGMMVIVPAALFTALLLLTETAEWALSSVAQEAQARHLRQASAFPARVDPCAHAQRTAVDGDADAELAGAPGLPEFRSDRARQQHLGRIAMAARGEPLRSAGLEVPFLPSRQRQGLQGRRAEQGAGTDRSRRRSSLP